MCSTPRPRTKITGKSASSASFLSSMSAESRRRFTEQANSAQARRDSIKMAKNKQKQIERVSAKQKSTAIETKKKPPLSYWLLDASLTEIAKQLLLKKSKANYKQRVLMVKSALTAFMAKGIGYIYYRGKDAI